MNVPNLRRLIDALRGGKFKQTTGHLKDDQNYCVWGVACEVFRQETGLGEWRTEMGSPFTKGLDAFRTPGDEYGDMYGPPEAVTQWYGLDRENNPQDDDFIEDLMSGNDCGITFKELAERIEERISTETSQKDSKIDTPTFINAAHWPPKGVVIS